MSFSMLCRSSSFSLLAFHMPLPDASSILLTTFRNACSPKMPTSRAPSHSLSQAITHCHRLQPGFLMVLWASQPAFEWALCLLRLQRQHMTCAA